MGCVQEAVRDMTRRTLVVATFLSVVAACWPRPGLAQDAVGMTDRFQAHGVAAPVSECRGAIATADAQGNPLILAMALDAGASLLVIDARNATTEQFWYPERGAISEPNYCLMVSSTGRFYAMMGDVFLEFDVGNREWSFAQDMKLGTAMALAEGGNGTIFAGTYPESQLLAFNPNARKLTHLGQLDPVEKYPSSLAADDSGWLYAGIGTARANLVAFHTQTGERRQLVGEPDRGHGTGKVYKGQDGHVYGQLPGNPWLRLSGGNAEPVQEPGPKAECRAINWQAVYRVFPDGATLETLDLPDKAFTVVDAVGSRAQHTFDYVSTGAPITSMTAGPGGKVYGSTCHPFRLFACDPATGSVTNLGGLKAVGGGNWCGLAAVGATVYGAEYAGGRLYAYDTTQPWQDSGDAAANPRTVAQYKSAICRPRTALAHPDGRVLLLLSDTLLEIAGEGFAVRRIAALPTPAGTGLALCGDRVYFAAGSHVWSCRVNSPP
jgi:hypothetical protein